MTRTPRAGADTRWRWSILWLLTCALVLSVMPGVAAQHHARPTLPPVPLPVPIGYGEATTGGEGAPVYWVTTLDDDGPGSLRAGAEMDEPRWVRFAVSGVVRLTRALEITSNKTIDGRGADITISGHAVELTGVSNIIIVNLKFADGPPGERDSLTMIQGTQDIWVDHSTFTGTQDELISVASGATNITLSWNRFHDHSKTILVGTKRTNDVDITFVTLHHNFFDRTGERNPRVTGATVHAYNNYLLGWANYGMAAVREAMLLVEANMFEPEDNNRGVRINGSADDNVKGFVRVVDNYEVTHTRIQEWEPETVEDPPYAFRVDEAGPDLIEEIKDGAGWQPPAFWNRAARAERPTSR